MEKIFRNSVDSGMTSLGISKIGQIASIVSFLILIVFAVPVHAAVVTPVITILNGGQEMSTNDIKAFPVREIRGQILPTK